MSPPNSDQTYSRHPVLTALGGPLAHWIERILDITSRVDGEPNYSIEQLGRVWDLATLALIDELDVDPQDLIDQLERATEAEYETWPDRAGDRRQMLLNWFNASACRAAATILEEYAVGKLGPRGEDPDATLECAQDPRAIADHWQHGPVSRSLRSE